MVALAITAGELAVRRRSCQERFGVNQFGFTRHFFYFFDFLFDQIGFGTQFREIGNLLPNFLTNSSNENNVFNNPPFNPHMCNTRCSRCRQHDGGRHPSPNMESNRRGHRLQLANDN
jgi:hypothetical protein